MIRESLVSLNRLLAYHTTTAKAADGPNKDAAVWVKDMQQDVAALSDHATYLSNKTSFLLDATLGLINLEQNQIIKIFSIAAVVFLPPTLVATDLRHELQGHARARLAVRLSFCACPDGDHGPHSVRVVQAQRLAMTAVRRVRTKDTSPRSPPTSACD